MPLSQYQQTLLQERREAQGGLIENVLDWMGRNITYTGEGDLTLEKILNPNPRDAIYAPPGEPTLAITKPRFLGRALATLPKQLKNLAGEFATGIKRQMRAIPEEAFEGVKDVGRISDPRFTAAYEPGARKIKFNPLQERRTSETAHELTHDWLEYPPARLPLETKRRAIEATKIHRDLRGRKDYIKEYYEKDPVEIASRVMGTLAKAWPSRKPIPIEAYDKYFDAALKISLKNMEKRWPGFYREALWDLPWKKAERVAGRSK
ncbi:hypothetical protein LCGC14_0992310 [marine sediment metagenome]|uniref:Uncharacterized protein n=1 Tax=marine sediment metagenome TaxID=412755 RepID=A0A0F9NS13_9ZZZZ